MGVLKGYKKLKDIEPGSLIRTRSGSYAVVSEYRTGNSGKNSYFDSYLLESGEYLLMNGDEWVAIIDLDFIEVEAVEEADYPNE